MKFTIIQAIAAIVAIACSVLCFKTYDAKSTGLNVVTADVVAQWGEVVKETEIDEDLEKEILAKIEERNQAKKDKDYAKADKIRNELLEKGIKLIDSREGTTYELI